MANTVGVTGLAVMAFLDAGYTPRSSATYQDEVTHLTVKVGDVIAKGLSWLVSQQLSGGNFTDGGAENLYEDAIATFALSDAVARCPSTSNATAAVRAVKFLEAARNPGAGWRYGFRCGNNDASVTAWCVLALRTAERARLRVDPTTFDQAALYAESLTNDEGYCGYTNRERTTNKAMLANTASSALCRHYAGRLPDADRRKILDLLATAVPGKSGVAEAMASLPADAKKLVEDALQKVKGVRMPGLADFTGDLNFYELYYGTLATFTLDGPDGHSWRQWNDALTRTLLAHQRGAGEGCPGGSWGDGAYSTAMGCLTLEVYYRYAPAGSVEPR